MLVVNPAAQRPGNNGGAFRIARTYPGINLQITGDHGLGPLGCFDDASMQPGFVVGMHEHRDDEILTYMRRGQMVHTDSHGSSATVTPTHLMMMNAGRTFFHEETNPRTSTEPVELLQIFIRPSAPNLPPAVQFHTFPEAVPTDGWRLVGGPAEAAAPLTIRSQVWVHDLRLTDAETALPDLQGLTGYLHVFRGTVTIPGHHLTLKTGDGLVIENEAIQVAAQGPADLVFFRLDRQAAYTRTGKYSG
ncbi:pirin family protein [Hymenobacter monticola]|uniref:Pirin family protein n=1 Tax=Hymenobacter monticola TaxID=1705399 RepID=A0ABY4BBR3_9BACT|nr:pirin family protein [Hymenobacter monticola]UOE36510.1 pirin family protein [Hymenobacter monticola]